MEKTLKLDKPKDSFDLGGKGITDVYLSAMTLQKAKTPTEAVVEGEKVTIMKTVAQASWVIRTQNASHPREGIRVTAAMPADLAKQIEDWQEAVSKKYVDAAD